MYVGIAEAVKGMAGLLTSLPIGYLSEKYSRSLIARIGGVFTVITLILTFLTILWIGEDHYIDKMTD